MSAFPDLPLESAVYRDVYEPREDTYLLCDALQDAGEVALLGDGPGALLCVEVGSGSGCASACLGRVLERAVGKPCHVIATDVNPAANEATLRVAAANSVPCDAVRCDLVSAVAKAGAVDVLMFNPPYVPTPSSEVGGTGISASWAGGVNGREVLDRLLPDVGALLRVGGLFYLVVVEENCVRDVDAALEGQGLVGREVLQRRAANELLSVWRWRKEPTVDVPAEAINFLGGPPAPAAAEPRAGGAGGAGGALRVLWLATPTGRNFYFAATAASAARLAGCRRRGEATVRAVLVRASRADVWRAEGRPGKPSAAFLMQYR